MASLGRSYLGESGVLRTRLSIGGGKVTVTVTDWLNFGDAPSGVLCCLVSPAPVAFELRLAPRPDFGRGAAVPVRLADKSFAIENGGTVHASHPLTMTGEDILCSVPAGERPGRCWRMTHPNLRRISPPCSAGATSRSLHGI